MSDVKLGLGLATGMFYTAPAGTALPTSASAQIPEGWTLVGDVTNDGITVTTDKSTENLKNWANKIKRTILTDHTESVQCPLMDTTEQTLKVVVGDENVSKSSGHITVNLSSSSLPESAAFLWVMKDGDDMMMLGCSQGQVTKVENINFAPGSGITWNPTITAQGDGLKFLFDAEGDED